MVKYFSINAEGCSIRCKLYTGDPAGVRSVILFGHGFGGHKDNKAAERFAGRVLEKNKGVAVVTFDWPCHGDDVRKALRLEDCDMYLRLVLAHIRDRFASPTVFAYAVSFGAYLFLKYISENGDPFAKTALRCPAVKMYEVLTSAIMTDEVREKLRRGKSAPVGFDRKIEIDRAFLDSLEQADVSQRDFLPYADELLILQGTKDEIVPFSTVRDFAEENVIEFVPVEGADHRFLDPAKMDFANAQILSFFGLK
ncbi:MAG: alpha/beta fold hydrolase [Oscillospiraceae bacterium]|nr:alpha/beta fold hydrolase [Oscillospiraceae bacterium]